MRTMIQTTRAKLKATILAALTATTFLLVGTNAHAQSSPDGFLFSGSFPSWSSQFSNLHTEVLKLNDGVYVSLAILETPERFGFSLIGHCSAYGYTLPGYDGSVICHYSLGRDTLEVVHKPNEPDSQARFYVVRIGFLDAVPVTDGWITPVPN